MGKMELTYLSREDIVAVGIDMAQIILIIEKSFMSHGSGRYESPPKPGIHPRQDAFIHAMPAYLPDIPAAGIKWISSFSNNSSHQIPTVMGLMILNDVNTGQPVVVMDASWLTAMRTAAASAVAVKFLARSNAQVVSIIGAGAQGYTHGLAMKEVLPGIKTLHLYDANERILSKCTRALQKQIEFDVIASESAESAIRQADVIITATSKLTRPIFKHEWVSPGALLLPVHTRGWETDTPHKMDKLVVDFWEQFKSAQEHEGGYYSSLPPLHAELGEIVIGKKPGRENDDERIMNHNYGMAIHDVAMAQAIFKRAREKRLGITLPLMDQDAAFY